MREDIKELMKEVDISTEEVAAYVKYFDYKRSKGFKRDWEHFTIRAFILSISYRGHGHYSAIRKVKDEILFRDVDELDGFDWLRGWILKKDNAGTWWVIVDGEKDSFNTFKEAYRQVG